jgi:hypothetical protein
MAKLIVQNENRIKNKTIKKPPRSGTIEFQSSFKFWNYSSVNQSLYWHISRSSDVVSPGDWLVSSVFFFFVYQFN